MTYLDAALLGLVEGLTEFLPVSSTGHLTLASHLLGIDLQNNDFARSFLIVVQLGAILAVVALYLRRLLRDFAVWKRIIAAFVPTGLLGLLLADFIDGVLLGNELIVVINLIGVGLLLLVADRYVGRHTRYTDINQLPLGQAALIGLFQAVAMVPGVSRSGATLVGGMLQGLSRPAAAEFSFLLALPTMLAASGLSLVRHADAFRGDQLGVLALGFTVAFAVALLTMRWMIGFVGRYNFLPFALYRIGVGLVYALFFLG
jgi:undecaprenyl-diphosphatase